MKYVWHLVFIAGSIVLALGCVQYFNGALAAEEPRADRPSDNSADIDPVLLEKIRPLYPEIQLKRRGAAPFFYRVTEVARVRLRDGKERLVVWVHLTIPAARVDHGRGDLLIFRDADDALPMVRKQMHTLSVIRGSEIHLIEDRWLRFGATSPLVSLVEEESLKHFGEHGLGGLIMGLSVSATRKALDVYLKGGREAFLKSVPIAKHQERSVTHLPGRISRGEIYPSSVEDMRESGFKYSSAWEGTVLVRLTPADQPQKRIILEIGTRASSAGITSDQVELLLWETREQEPTDRPTP